ncbi:zinc finger protein Xfin-like [Plodia interpunctella]|uniref:zinc finger protein Xfin-like n=1 Tax=Plodia interpunctella TaxID=58824 RepID=UPI00236837DB|nr:zinc finger protein Xfin-like [Plodia interpunctella]
MASDNSDDEPLSTLATKTSIRKKTNEEVPITSDANDDEYLPKKKKKKKNKKANTQPKISLTIKIRGKGRTQHLPKVVERPTDVWLYLKDLNPAGPFSCLLCSEWFINRTKMIVHYVLNHKKDFCGICRYFVPDREAWLKHIKFHVPWPCSQCVENFQTEDEVRLHLSGAHKLVHCRLCHFRMPDDDQYNMHLLQKHNVTNVNSKDEEQLWELESEGDTMFLCLLCSKSNNPAQSFFSHYMGFHHFTLKCFTRIISGRDPPFAVFGAQVSSHFIENQLKNQVRFGYVELENKQGEIPEIESGDAQALLSALIPEIKQEVGSDDDKEAVDEISKENEEIDEQRNEILKAYKGDEDFDITLVELIIMEKSYVEYLNHTLLDINANVVPEVSDIEYESVKAEFPSEVSCGLCGTRHNTPHTFTAHMTKMHLMKSLPVYCCRVCATTFDCKNELESHINEELGEFDDLWICQFCDKEFDNRESTRRHLNEHSEELEFDNCFSPHLGFKCRYCPMLFWNEPDREAHQMDIHFEKHKEDYYKCQICSELFSDKVFFVHHFFEKHHSTETEPPTFLLKCCRCCLVLTSLDEMRSHFTDNHPEARKIYCSFDACLYKPLSHMKSFKLHLKLVHAPSNRVDRRINCAICSREFSSSRACSTHMAQAHGPGKFRCKLCRELLHTNDERKLHYLLRHPGRHPFECKECGKSFQYKSSLYMHRQDHVKNKQIYKCEECGKTFLKKDSFREHQMIHEGPRHACSYCPMRFVQRSNMLRHERRHTGERPYACPHCPRTFADKGACTSHARTHSRETSYGCLYCGQTFVQKSKLTYHIRKHTGENLETCPICSKHFTSGCSLREHMKIHDAKKDSVKCPLCDKHYSDSRYMLRHLRTSHTRAQHSCPICAKFFATSTALKYHVITHSERDTFKCKICPKTYAVKKSIVKHLRKRHGLRDTEVSLKEYYERLDPRECNLGLDEEEMTRIFGPSKNKHQLIIPDVNNDNGDGAGEKSHEVMIKNEPLSGDEEELPIPTDFVTVKIEPHPLFDAEEK